MIIRHILHLPATLFPVVLLLALGGVLLDRVFPPDLSRLSAVGGEVTDYAGRPLAVLPAADHAWRLRADPATVPPALTTLLLRSEDRRFAWHPGVDPVALLRAAGQFARTGRVISGGSTLSMQAARLLEPRPRTLRAKLIEMGRALQLEARYGRRGVLGIWLTLAPMGGNLEGVRAGAWAWFGKSVEALAPDEAALLVAIPRRPESLRPDRHPDAAAVVRARVLALLPSAPEAGPVPLARLAMPHDAPHAMADLRRLATGSSEGPIRSTLDRPLQQSLQVLARDRLRDLPPRASLAILVTDAASGAVRGLIGGDWANPDRAGALDLTQAVRSPGSALKPFIYALAFEDGLAEPDTMLTDMPERFGDYAPENIDRRFNGRVSAADALRRSLNVPAVALLDRIGALRFTAALREAAAPLAVPGNASASLALALGGAGITPRSLAMLYGALATDGAVVTPALSPVDHPSRRPFLAPDAARAVAAILTRPFPDGGRPGIAWKTGTSWGGRDAWAVGFDARHVVAVWVGRPDGTPLPGATGASEALPILASVFDRLPSAPRSSPVPAPSVLSSPNVEPPVDAVRLIFPPSGSTLSGDGPVTLRAMGGRRPLTFLVDGAPVAGEAARREAAWTPPGPGFFNLTVLDRDGQAARSMVEVR